MSERGLELARATHEATQLLQQLAPGGDKLPALRQRAAALSQRADRLSALPAADPARKRGGESILVEVLALAEDVAAVDDTIEFTVVRARLDSVNEREAVLGYAATLAAVATSQRRLDRIDFLVTRLLTLEAAGGKRDVVDEAEVSAVLARVAPDAAVEPARREVAMGFFESSAERVENAASVDDLFSSGLYIDIKGFKASLGVERLDPAIFFASVLLSVGIGNLVASASAASASAEDTSQTADPARSEAQRKRRVDRRFEKARESVARRAVARLQTLNWRTIALAAATVIAGVLAVWNNAPEQRLHVESADSALIADISELLIAGGFSSGDGKRVFLGEVRAEVWRTLDHAARTSEVQSMSTQLREGMHTQEAMIVVDERVVAQIVGGHVVFVEPPRQAESTGEES